jgi:transcriptional regulator with XRE-family HTH domain
MLKRKPEPGDLATSAQAFGELLKDLRETAAMSQTKLAASIPCDRSLIARIESGSRVPQKNLVEALDETLDTGGLLYRLWLRINWYPVVEHPDWFKRRAAMDAEAVALRVYGAMVVPGLLQTPGYARAKFAHEVGNPEERVEARLSRQHRFEDPEGPLLVAVLDESCIRNVVGSREIMREQCERLLTLGQQSNILIHVAPFAGADLLPPDQPMTLITLPEGQEWVYSESLDRGHLADDPTVYARHLRRYDLLRADALSVQASAALIREAMEGYGDDEHPRPDGRDVDQEQLQRQQRGRLRGGQPRLRPGPLDQVHPQRQQRRQLRGSGPRLYGRRPRPRLEEP